MSSQDPFGTLGPSQPIDPTDPTQRIQGRKILSNALQNFVFSLGQGLSATAQYPGRRGTTAGMGAALQGPMMLQQIQEQQRNQQQDRLLKVQQLRRQILEGQQADQERNIQNQMRAISLATGSNAPEYGGADLGPTNPQPQSPEGSHWVGGVDVGTAPTQAMPVSGQVAPVVGHIPPRTINFGGGVDPLTVWPKSAQDIAGAKTAEERAKIIAAAQAKPQMDIGTFGEDGLFNKVNGTILRQPTPKASTTSLELKDFNMKAGGHKPLNYDPKLGRMFDPVSKQDVTGDVTGFYEKPPVDRTNTVQYQDPKSGQWQIGRIDDKGNIVPATINGVTPGGTAGKLTGMAANRAVAAASIEKLVPSLIQKINANRAKIGAVVGEGEDFLLKQGIKDPELRDLQSSLKSMAPLISTLHAGRNTEYMMKDFAASSARLGEDPDNAIAALKAQLQVAQTIANVQNDVLGANGGGAPAASPSPGGDMLKVQAKDGTVGMIPRANLAEAIKRGAKVVP